VNTIIPKPLPPLSIYSRQFSALGKWAGMCMWLFFSFAGNLTAQDAPTWDYLFIGSRSFDSHRDFFPSLNDEERQMVDSLKKFAESPYIQMIYQNAGKYYLMNACNLVLYHWQGDDWMPYAGKPVKGATCGTVLFFRDNEPYSYSGVGFWQSHGDIFHFTQTGEAELVKTHHPLSNFYGTLRFTTNSGLYSFFGHHYNLRTEGPEGFLWKGYFLDFSDMRWKEMDFELNENFEKVFGVKTFDKKLSSLYSFESDDFGVTELRNQLTQQTGLVIVDKRTMELWIQPLNNSYFLDLIWLQKKGNSLRFFTGSKPTITKLEMTELIKTALPLGKVSLKEDQRIKDLIGAYWKEGAGAILMLMVLLVALKILSPRRYPDDSDSSSPVNFEHKHLLHALQHYSGQVIPQEVLDQVLDIGDLKNQDLRKVRRSRAIKALNEHMLERQGKPVIQRIRDEQDMRIIRYRIENIALTKSTKTPKTRMTI
jgi:hypothetical protein